MKVLNSELSWIVIIESILHLKISLAVLLTVLASISLLPNVYASRSAQIIVAPSGLANVSLTYTFQDFDAVYSAYASSGEAAFKASIIQAVAVLGWTIDANRISFSIDQSTKTMSILFPVNQFAQKISDRWQILLGPAKPIYSNWTRTSNTFVFTSTTMPQSPLPEGVTLQLPVNVVDVQFDSVNYVITYLAPSCIIATATYGSELAPEVVYMRNVRDNMIGSNDVGKSIVIGWNSFYYSWSPQVAQFIDTYGTTKPIFRVLLLPLVGTVHLTAVIYDTISIVNTSLASIVAFLIAALSSISIYVVCPLLTIRLIYRKARSIH